jgi:hypothetical protein
MKAVFSKRQSVARVTIFTILALSAACVVSANSITGGAVTGGSAFTAGGTFVNLTVPWGSVTTPANTVGNANFGTPDLYAFAEAQNFVLTSPLTTDVGLTTIPKGTTVSSFFVTFEPGANTYQLIGDVTFNAPVLGIITSDASLIASNFLGDAGITYLDPVDVGLEPGDLATIDTSHSNQIDWNTVASNPGDAVRVILDAPAVVPEPSTLLISCLGLIGLAVLRKRRIG